MAEKITKADEVIPGNTKLVIFKMRNALGRSMSVKLNRQKKAGYVRLARKILALRKCFSFEFTYML